MALISSIGEVNLDALDKSIADTAVDIFVYDTRKDSDGGKWRKRTKKTSWYNETLNTATRGSRREFPAVAVIVAEINKVTIYDGDDPDLPMWMVFNKPSTGYTEAIAYGNNIQAVYHLNGKLSVSTNDGHSLIDFISEDCRTLRASTQTNKNATMYGGIVNRNGNMTYVLNAFNSSYNIGNSPSANDVAMTVLPNAPIDSTTGLPIPTIAVATNGGVSVIKNDGTVVDAVGTTFDVVNSISFDKNNRIICSSGTAGTDQAFFSTFAIPSADLSNVFPGGDNGYYRDGYSSTDLPWYASTGSAGNHSINEVSSYGDYISFGTEDDGSTLNPGLKIISENISNPSEGMLCGVSTSYNTGWMHGDIKGAFLSDTDATNVSASTNLVTNGTFDSDISGWSAYNSTLALSNNEIEITRTSQWGFATQQVTLEVGKNYILTADGRSNGTGNATIGIKGSVGNVAWITPTSGTANTTMTPLAVFFTATQTTGYIHLQTPNASGAIAYFDNVSLTEVKEQDRSVNNKGLQVFGTITKTPVATGAELVGYRPPSGTVGNNYLSRPLTSSDFDLTSDWSITFWAKRNEQTADNYSGFEIAEDDLTGNTAYQQIPFSIFIDTSGHTGWRGANVTGYQYNDLFNTQDVWKCITTVSKSGSLYIYINGEYVTSTPATFTNPSTPYSLGIFRFSYSTSRHDGRRHIDYALFRMSNSAPSAAQVKKMYEDEKVLFQENAACTLYGSSDAVRALAYDDKTNLLHVGTSSGRSDFKGLRRINNTTTGITTAISASNRLIAEQ